MRQIVDDIEFCGLDVRTNGEGKVNEACTPTYESVDIGEPGSVAQYIFLRLDDIGLHLLGRGCPPEISDRYLRLFDVGQ